MSDSKQLFDDVSNGLAKIFAKKQAQYGNSAFYTGEPGSPFKWWMRFSDVSRKFTRLERLTQIAADRAGIPSDRDQAREKLIDDYKDLAIYAIIAVAVLEEKK